MFLSLHKKVFPRKKKSLLSNKTILVFSVGIVFGLFFVWYFLLRGEGASAAWWNDTWQYRKSITVSIDSNTSDVTDVETLLTIDTDDLISTGKMQVDCDDIRFTSQSGKSLPYFLDSGCNSNSTKVWVLADVIPKNTTTYTLYMYYGNASALSESDTEIFYKVRGLIGYWPMNEASWNGTTGEIKDYSINGNNGTRVGNATTTADGKYGYTGTFDGNGDYASFGDQSTFDLTLPFSIFTWIKVDTMPSVKGSDAEIISKYGGTSVRQWTLSIGGTDGLYFWKSHNGTNGEYIANGHYLTGSDVNVWRHVGFTADASGNYRLYYEGTVVDSGTFTNQTIYQGGSADMRIGSRATNANYFMGEIDDTRIYNRDLSQEEVTKLFSEGGNIATVSEATANPSLTFGTEEVTRGPVIYWKFDEGYGTTVNDSSGNSITGTLGTGSSAPAWRDESMCVSGKCLQFDGNDYVGGISANPGDEFTISGWVKTNNITTQQTIFRHRKAFRDIWLMLFNDKVSFSFYDTSGTQYAVTSNTSIATNSWYYISSTYDGSVMRIYINGVQDGNTTSVNTSVEWVSPLDQNIGANKYDNSQYFSGFIDEVKIYPYARSADEIKQDYLFTSAKGSSVVLGATDNSFLSDSLVGYWKMDEVSADTCVGGVNDSCDASGQGNDGAWQGTLNSTGKYGNSVSVNGGGQYVNYGDKAAHDLTLPFTISTWINIAKLPSVKGANETIISKYNFAPNRQWTLEIGTSDEMYFWKSHNGTNGEYLVSDHTFTSADVGVWRQVGITIDAAGTYRFFVDGEQVGSGTVTNTTIYTSSSNINMWVGARNTGPNYFEGKIDEVRLYKRALDASEMKKLYEWAPGPVAYYDLDEGTGISTISDKSGNGNTLTMTDFDESSWRPGKYGSALHFRGNDANDELSANSILNDLPTGDFTTSFWFNWEGDGSMNWDVPIGKREVSPGGWWVTYEGTNKTIQMQADFGTSDLNYVSASNVYSFNEWNHATVVFKSATKTAEFYINGVKTGYGATTQAGVGTYQGDSGNTFRIGRDNEAGQRWNGMLDEIKIYNYARTPSQIIEDMNGGHPLGGSPVGSQLAYWKFDEGYGDYAYDTIGNSNAWLAAGDVCPGDSECPTWTNDGKFGKAIFFDGGDLIEAEMIAGYDNNGTDPYTATLWFKSDTNPTYNYALMGIVSNFGGNQDRFIQVTSAGVPRFYVYDGQERYATGTTVVTDNAWHHLAGIFDGTTIYIYVDGELEGTATVTGSENHTNPYIRFSHQVNNYYNHTVGTIDEAKIYGTALTKEQVLLDMNQGRSMVLGAQNTGIGGTTPSNSTSRSYCLPGDTSTCNSPVFEMNFEEATGQIAYDTSTNGNNGTLGTSASIGSDDPTWGLGPDHMAGSALEFDGVNDFVEIDGDEHVMTGEQFTVSAWFKSGDTGTSRRTIYNEGSEVGFTFTNMFIALNDGAAGRIRAFLRDEDTSSADIMYSGGYNDNNWHFVSFVKRSASSHELFVDGALVGTSSTTIDGPYDSITAQTIGRREQESAEGDYFVGSIDQVRVFDYARTPAQIAWEYSKGAPIAHYKLDECQGTTAYNTAFRPSGLAGNDGAITSSTTGNTSVGTCTSGSSTEMWANGVNGKWNASLDFDGVNDRVVIPDIDYGQETTISFWFNSTNNSGTGYQYMFSQGGFQVANSINIYFNEDSETINTPGAILVSVMDSNDNPPLLADDIQTQVGLSDSAWHHLAVVISASGTKAYVDGVQQVSYANGNNGVNPSGNIYIGSRYDLNSARFYDGKLDDIRIYNYAMTPAQITEMYKGGAVVFK